MDDRGFGVAHRNIGFRFSYDVSRKLRRKLCPLLLGFTFLTTGPIWCFFLVWSASSLSRSLRENARVAKWLQKSCGAVFILLGMQVALRE